MRIFKTSGVVSLLVVLQWLTGIATAQAATVTTGGPPKSIMIQLSNWETGVGDLVSKLNTICADHRDPSKPGLIQNLVLTDIASADPDASSIETTPTANDTLLNDKLGALLPYFPGGKGPCTFDNVFVGTVDLNAARPPGESSSWISYREGITNASWRTNALQRSLKIAQAFRNYVSNSGNRDVVYHWYVSQEALLELFTDPAVEQGYEAFMIQHIKDLSSVAPDRAFIWSPSFQALPYNVSEPNKTLLQTNLKTFFDNVRSGVRAFNGYHANDGGPLWLHLQDHVGSMAGFSPPMTKEDAANWYFFVSGLFPFTSIGMNVEQFTTINRKCCFPADPAEIISREQYYAEQKIDLGAAFELKYWAANNHQ